MRLRRFLQQTDQISETLGALMHTANEQLFLELVNAARLDPLGEAARQGIDLNEGLAPGTIADTPVQALAPNAQVQQAAADHGQWILDTDTFQHTGEGGSSPGDRMEAAGYNFAGSWSWGENLALLRTTGTIDLESAIQSHHDGLYESPGHRENLFAAHFRETGISQQRGEFEAGWDSSVLTHKFATSGSDFFLTGVIYNDFNFDFAYSVGEGRDAFQISAAEVTTATWAAGGYSLALGSDPAVSVTLGQPGSGISLTVDMSQGNVKLDLLNGDRILTSGNVVLGEGATDVQMLGAVDNSATGNAFDNWFYVGRGDNSLTGGGGLDTVVFTGQRSEFDIAETGTGQFTITDLRDGPESDGTNTLTDITFAQFTDSTISLQPAGTGTAISGLVSTPAAQGAADLVLSFSLSDGSEQTLTTDTSGHFDLHLPTGLTGHIDLAPGATSTQTPDVGDALDILRIAVGLAPSFGPATPHDLIAADVDSSGDITVNDALNVLRAAVGLETPGAAPGDYLLFDSSQSFDGLHAGSVTYERGADLDHGLDGGTLDLQLVTLGDLGATQAV